MSAFSGARHCPSWQIVSSTVERIRSTAVEDAWTHLEARLNKMEKVSLLFHHHPPGLMEVSSADRALLSSSLLPCLLLISQGTNNPPMWSQTWGHSQSQQSIEVSIKVNKRQEKNQGHLMLIKTDPEEGTEALTSSERLVLLPLHPLLPPPSSHLLVLCISHCMPC